MSNRAVEVPKDLAVLQVMKNASETVRSAIASAIPVASTQALTVSVPGTLINYQNFVYNANDSIKTPLTVRVAEARLVDGMIPLSKFTTGKTGKSVARSYLATLDLLVPVEATVSGIISTDHPVPVDGRLKVVRDRYVKAMDYLKSADDAPGANGRSKLATYVQKQENWAKAVEAYSYAQDRALHAFKPGPNPSAAEIKRAREEYLQWIQEHGRDFKHAIQARYMDWVVHGYKFMVDFNFGIVDISSGMKRVENSKEAFRNLTLIAEDGVSEYSSVILTPNNWATIVKEKVEAWDERNKNPTPSEIRAELRRLNNLLASHKALRDGIEKKAIFPILSQIQDIDDSELKRAYAKVYANLSENNENALKLQPASVDVVKTWMDIYGASPQSSEKASDPFRNLVDAQDKWNVENLKRNNTTLKASEQADIDWALNSIDKKMDEIIDQTIVLKSKLPGGGRAVMTLPVMDEKGVTITEADTFANPGLVGKPTLEKPSSWTRVSCKVCTTTDVSQSGTSQSVTNQASSAVVKDPWNFWRTSTAASTSETSESTTNAIASMANLSVEISMDCMVVEIERPWLHAELFSDAELDSGKFDISPGEAKLKEIFEAGEVPRAEHQQFSSYPTAFVIAADIELNFSGDTSALENAVSAANASANESIGYGPFSVSASASRSQSKSSSKTKMESTATGCKISIQAPQIIGWVQTLLPQLPRDMSSPSRMVGLSY